MAEVARIANEPDDAVTPEPIGLSGDHVLVLGDEEFVCGDKLPLSTLIRYADNDLLGLHKILVKLVPEEDHERMWDAFEDLEEDEVGAAIGKLVESYSERPTDRPGPSRSGSRNARRK